MAETQVIFRVDQKTLKELDRLISAHGFKTRNEWFRAKVREFIEESKKKAMLGKLSTLDVEGIEEEDIIAMVHDWRRKKKLENLQRFDEIAAASKLGKEDVAELDHLVKKSLAARTRKNSKRSIA
jgi:metal-responsive CopG/Arc/MetJ family transcriptional regulator